MHSCRKYTVNLMEKISSFFTDFFFGVYCILYGNALQEEVLRQKNVLIGWGEIKLRFFFFAVHFC